MEQHHDVVIIGAGISGINAAYRVQTELPNYDYTILEARNALGGTWDFFRYPGIRSDSDLYTFGFSWKPWIKENSIADGPSIRTYMKEAAAEFGIDRKIQFHNRCLAADWSTKEQQWNLTVNAKGVETTIHARFIIMGSGFYDYTTPMKTHIPGIENFKGKIIHPQFWPEDYDYSGKSMVIIGSGATAVTLLPVVAQKTRHVTLLQRSPGYLVSSAQVNPVTNFILANLPTWLAYKILLWEFVLLSFYFYYYCQWFPKKAIQMLRKRTEPQLPEKLPYEPNFSPKYNPWDQRLCLCPDGNFFKALHKDSVDVVTSRITNVTENSIVTETGKTLETDIIVTATGLKLQLGGGADLSIDGVPFRLSDKVLWKGVMAQDVPNMTFMLGHHNVSWTLGADSSAKLTCRLLKYMDRKGMAYATPYMSESEQTKGEVPFLQLTSTYVANSRDSMPKSGRVGPWKPRSHWLKNEWIVKYGSLTTGMKYTKSNFI